MPPPSEFCNTYINPIDSDTFVTIICATNGALSRNKLCDEHAGGDWAKFDDLMNSAPVGNDSQIGIYCDVEETVPSIPKPGVYRHNCRTSSEQDTPFSPAAECRAIVESRAMSFKLRAESCGLMNSSGESTEGGKKERRGEERRAVSKTSLLAPDTRSLSLSRRIAASPLLFVCCIPLNQPRVHSHRHFLSPRSKRSNVLCLFLFSPPLSFSLLLGHVTRIICTGGSANSGVFLQTLSDVFGCPVFVPEGVSNGAALGAAVRAAHGAFNAGSPRTRQVSFDSLCGGMLRSSMREVATPDVFNAEVYTSLIAGYDDFECDVQYKAAEWKAEREQRELERKAEVKMSSKARAKEVLDEKKKGGGANEEPDYTMLYFGIIVGVVISVGWIRHGIAKR